MNNGMTICISKSPLRWHIYISLLLMLSILFVLLLTQGRYGKQVPVKGIIRNESFYRIFPDKVGNVLDIYVKEGDFVHKGEPLFRISLLWQDANNQEYNKSIRDETINRLNTLKEKYVKEQFFHEQEWQVLLQQKADYLKQHNETIITLGEIEKDYKRKKTIISKQVSEYEKLVNAKSINKAEMENVKQLSIDNDLAIKKLEIEKTNVMRENSEKGLYFSRMEREIEQNKNLLEKRLSDVFNELNSIKMQQEYVAVSPVDAVVHDVGILRGDLIDSQTTPIILRENKNSPSIVILYLTNSQIGLLDKNQDIFLRVDTFPYETYGTLRAQVINISDSPTKIGMDDKESLFRIKLKLYENDVTSKIPLEYLKDGMTVTGSLRQPEQTLLEWLFLPVKRAFKRNPDTMNEKEI